METLEHQSLWIVNTAAAERNCILVCPTQYTACSRSGVWRGFATDISVSWLAVLHWCGVILLRQNDAECSLFVTLSGRVSTTTAGCKSQMDRCFMFVTRSPACFPLDGSGISEHLPAWLTWPRWVTAFWGEYPRDLLLLQATYEQFQRWRVKTAFLGTRAENSSVLAFQTQLFRPGLFLNILLSDM